VKYNTLYFIFIKCVLCEAVGSADQNHKTFKTFLFFTRKKKQKNLPSATSATEGLALHLVQKSARDRQYFLKDYFKKSPPLNPCQFLFCPFCLAYRKPDSARIKFLLSFGFLVSRTKPLKIKKIQERSLVSFIQQSRPIEVNKDVLFTPIKISKSTVIPVESKFKNESICYFSAFQASGDI